MLQWLTKGDPLPPQGIDIVVDTSSTASSSSATSGTAETDQTESGATMVTSNQFSQRLTGGGFSNVQSYSSSASGSSTRNYSTTGATEVSSGSFNNEAANGYTAEGATFVDSAGNLTFTSSYSASGSFSGTSTGSGSGSSSGSGVAGTRTTSSSTTASFTYSGSTSGSTESSSSWSSTLGSGPASDPWQTTSAATETSEYATWQASNIPAAVLTVSSFVSSFGSGTNTSTSVVYTTALTGTTLEWHAAVSSTRSTTSAGVTTDQEREINFADKAVIEASPCCQLWWAQGGVDGVKAFCEVFSSLGGRVTVTPDLESTSTTATDAFGGGTTTYGISSPALSQTNGPEVLLAGAYTLAAPVMIAVGYRPGSAVNLTDPVYDGYTINVASSVTDDDEWNARFIGSTIQALSITEVLTLNSDDTLSLGSVVSDSTTTAMVAGVGGGFTNFPGDQTLTLGEGVFGLTFYSSDGGSVGTKTSVNSATIFTFAQSVQAVVQPFAYCRPGSPWLCASIAGLVEVSCNAA